MVSCFSLLFFSAYMVIVDVDFTVVVELCGRTLWHICWCFTTRRDEKEMKAIISSSNSEFRYTSSGWMAKWYSIQFHHPHLSLSLPSPECDFMPFVYHFAIQPDEQEIITFIYGHSFPVPTAASWLFLFFLAMAFTLFTVSLRSHGIRYFLFFCSQHHGIYILPHSFLACEMKAIISSSISEFRYTSSGWMAKGYTKA